MNDFVDQEMEKLLKSTETKKILKKAYKSDDVVPKKINIFKPFELCPLSKVKIVILGQDPYPKENVADGLAFSTNKNITPHSLKNIFKEIKSEYKNSKFKTNNLSCWALQGVLLLNTCLTTKKGKSMSHSKIGWNNFVIKIFQLINTYKNNVIFVLWGNNAKKFQKFINKDKHYILFSAHPSPLSANKGFFGNNHFKKINNILRKNKINKIDWNTY